MDETRISGPSWIAIESACSAAATLALLVIAAAALRSVLGLMWTRCDVARARCRRWAKVTSACAIGWYALAPSISVAPHVPILVVILAVDCWIVLWDSSIPTIPRAMARRSARPS